MFDKKKCMDNIYTIAKDKDIKIGELEKAAGVSAGYLSKLSKEGNKAVPGVEILLPIAAELGVSLDFLVNSEYKSLGANERYFASFVDKLMVGTENQKIIWEIESGSYLNSVTTGMQFSHPLFLHREVLEENPFIDQFDTMIYNDYQSRFLRVNEINSFDNCYHCELKGGLSGIRHLYMMKIYPGCNNYEEEHSALNSHSEIELYFVKGLEKVEPLCSTYSVGKEIKKIIEDLYSLVSNDIHSISITRSVKQVIDDFMNIEW